MSNPPASIESQVLPVPPLQPQVLSYAAPPMGYAALWREGKQFVTTRDARLDDVCIKCGAPAQGKRWRKTLYWHHPAFYLMIIFPGLLVYIIVAICVRKKAKIDLALCPAHRKRRRLGIALTTILALAGIPLFLGGMIAATDRHTQTDGLIALFAGFLMIVASFFTGWGMARVVIARWMDDHFARYSGAGEPFLAQLGTKG